MIKKTFKLFIYKNVTYDKTRKFEAPIRHHLPPSALS